MLKLDDILRSLNQPLSTARLEQLRELLPMLEEQQRITQARLELVRQSPSSRRKSSRLNDRIESQRDAIQAITSYQMTIELTLNRVRSLIVQGTKLQESQQFAEHIHKDAW